MHMEVRSPLTSVPKIKPRMSTSVNKSFNSTLIPKKCSISPRKDNYQSN